MSNYEPIKIEFDTILGVVTITPENINLVPQQYLDEYTYSFNVVCEIFKVQIVAAFVDGIWIVIKLNNYIVYDNNKYMEIHNLIYDEIIPKLKIFDNLFFKEYLTIKQDLYFNESKIEIKRIRKSSTSVTCRIVFINNIKTKLKDLQAIFVIDNSNIHQPKFILDTFIYDEDNIAMSEYIDKYGSQLRIFLDTNINYVRII